MNLEFLPEARSEFAEAVEFYENKDPGLGKGSNARLGKYARLLWLIRSCGANGRADSDG